MNTRTIQYSYACTKERRPSIIVENDEHIFTTTGKPQAGYSAYTRFFGASPKDQPKFVVKQPKAKNILEEAEFIEAYQREQAVWNSVYPNQQATLITEGGVRLILPCLPGETLRTAESDDPILHHKQALAVIRAILKFHQLGWSHSDFSTDNVLVEEKPDGTVEAYLIDFGRVTRREESISNTEWVVVGALLYRVDSLPVPRHRVGNDNAHLVTEHLLREIERLETLNQPRARSG